MSKDFVPHKSVPGPPRLDMTASDNSGAVNTDPMFMADRLAIVNHVMAYAFLIDEGRWDEWFGLFSDDVDFETTAPEVGTLKLHGKPIFQEFVKHRYVIPGKNSKTVRRHTQGNCHVAEQTATTAKVRTYMFISSVPAANHLHMLTSGTYNANLEKRDGKWTITRWYIEVDAPLSPSPLPEGFPADQMEVTLDPSTKLPGAPEVAVPVKGQITLKNLPFAQGALWEHAPQWSWTDIDVVTVDYLTTAGAAAAHLPAQCATVPIPELPGYAAVKQVWANYRDSSFGPYMELFIAIPCLFNGQLFLHVPFIYVNTDRALTAGREIGGWPKKLADIRLDRFGNEFRCSFDRGGDRIVSASMTVGGKLFSTPLPADKPVSLPFPYNMTWPLPAPTGKEQAAVALPTTSLKFFPGVGPGNPTPSLAQLIGAQWRATGDFYSCSGTTTSYRPSKTDPMDQLPVLKVLDSLFLAGNITLALEDVQVLDDLLKK